MPGQGKYTYDTTLDNHSASVSATIISFSILFSLSCNHSGLSSSNISPTTVLCYDAHPTAVTGGAGTECTIPRISLSLFTARLRPSPTHINLLFNLTVTNLEIYKHTIEQKRSKAHCL